MIALGYSMSSEEHPADELVKQAKPAEQAGFAFAMISDHFHPWTHRQGNSPFVWSVLGAIRARYRTNLDWYCRDLSNCQNPSRHYRAGRGYCGFNDARKIYAGAGQRRKA